LYNRALRGGEHGVSGTEAESDDTDLSRLGVVPDGLDGLVDERLGDSFTVLDDPRAKVDSGLGSVGNSLDGGLWWCGVLGDDGVHEVLVDVVAFEDVRDIDVESSLGVFISQNSNVPQLVTKDVRDEDERLLLAPIVGLGDVGGESGEGGLRTQGLAVVEVSGDTA